MFAGAVTLTSVVVFVRTNATAYESFDVMTYSEDVYVNDYDTPLNGIGSYSTVFVGRSIENTGNPAGYLTVTTNGYFHDFESASDYLDARASKRVCAAVFVGAPTAGILLTLLRSAPVSRQLWPLIDRKNRWRFIKVTYRMDSPKIYFTRCQILQNRTPFAFVALLIQLFFSAQLHHLLRMTDKLDRIAALNQSNVRNRSRIRETFSGSSALICAARECRSGDTEN